MSGKALNQDVTLMTGGILKSKELHISNDNKRFCRGNAEICATTLVDAKVRNRRLYLHLWESKTNQ
jgi:hypothetical protein